MSKEKEKKQKEQIEFLQKSLAQKNKEIADLKMLHVAADNYIKVMEPENIAMAKSFQMIRLMIAIKGNKATMNTSPEFVKENIERFIPKKASNEKSKGDC